RMASCAILAMGTVSRRCLGKSAQITYCRQCAVMVPFFYELRDHGHWGMLAFVFGFGTWLRQKDRVMLSCSRSYVLPDETAQFALPNGQVDRRLTTIPQGFSLTLQSSGRHASGPSVQSGYVVVSPSRLWRSWAVVDGDGLIGPPVTIRIQRPTDQLE